MPNPMGIEDAPLRAKDWMDYRPLTALFADLEGSVELLTQLGPEQYNLLLRRFHGLVTTAVAEFGGEVSQYLGDGVLCFFHHGHASLNRASAAIAAALAIQQGLQQDTGPDQPCPRARIGIASGLALFNEETTAAGARLIGSCINLAARIQSLAPSGTVLICEESQSNAAANFALTALPAQEVKGFPEPLRLWQVAPQGAPQSRAEERVFIGREAELLRLLAALEDSRSGKDRKIAILGQAGLGKTRLMQRFLESEAAQACPKILLRCTRDEAGRDFHPIRSYLQGVVGLGAEDDLAARAGKLSAFLAQDWGLGADQISDMLLILGSHPEKDAQPHQPPLLLRRWFIAAFIARLAQIRRANPALILCIEDAHWLDPSSAELLAALSEQSPALGLTLVYTQRTARQEDAPLSAADDTIRLPPLSPAQSGAVIQAVWGQITLPEETLAWIRDRASGVPLFLSVFAEYARKQNTNALTPTALPLDLLDILEQSLSRLPAATRRFIQAAAVMGAHFDPKQIAKLQAEDERALYRHLELLTQEKLVSLQSDGSGAAFTHDLLRGAIYDNLGQDLRRRLHGSLAEAMARTAPPDILAHHHERAAQTREALLQYHRASLAAAAVGALQEASAYLNKALLLLDTLQEPEEKRAKELMLRRTEGPLQMILGGPGSQAFGRAQRRATELMEGREHPRERAHLLYNSGLHDWARLRLDAAGAQAKELLALKEGGEEARLAGHTLAGLAAWHGGDNPAARVEFEQVIALYRIEDHAGLYQKYLKDFGVFSLFYAGLEASLRGDFDTARLYAARAQTTSEALAIPHAQGFGRLAQFMTAVLRKDASAASQHARAAETLARNHGFPEFVAMAVFVQGWAQSRQAERPEAGLSQMEDGLSQWRNTDFLAWQSLFEILLIEARLRLSGAKAAEAGIAALKAGLNRSAEGQFLPPARIVEARFYAQMGAPAEAMALLKDAEEAAKRNGARLWQQEAVLLAKGLSRGAHD